MIPTLARHERLHKVVFIASLQFQLFYGSVNWVFIMMKVKTAGEIGIFRPRFSRSEKTAINSYSLQIGTWAICRNCQAPAEEVTRLNLKWKNKSSAFLRLSSCCISLISTFLRKSMGTKIIFLYLQCDERWVRRLPWLTNKRFSSAEPFIFYGKVLESKKCYICGAVRRPAKAERAVLFYKSLS